MKFNENKLYHIYNRGNNKQPIFFKPDNYLFFLAKVRKHIKPCCDILAYTLMPDHFRFLIHADIRTIQKITKGKQQRNVLSEGFKNLLSSYCQAINKQNGTTGSLFQQNTKAKCLNDGPINYGPLAFHDIHRETFRERQLKSLDDWEYSSFKDYAGLRKGTLCNKNLALELLDLNEEKYLRSSYAIIDNELIKNIFCGNGRRRHTVSLRS